MINIESSHTRIGKFNCDDVAVREECFLETQRYNFLGDARIDDFSTNEMKRNATFLGDARIDDFSTNERKEPDGPTEPTLDKKLNFHKYKQQGQREAGLPGCLTFFY